MFAETITAYLFFLMQETVESRISNEVITIKFLFIDLNRFEYLLQDMSSRNGYTEDSQSSTEILRQAQDST